MKIGGLQRISLIDYPGKIGATVFTQGCNFRCPYCHNPELVDPDQYGPETPEEEVLDFLKQRRNKMNWDEYFITTKEKLSVQLKELEISNV